MKRGRSTQEAYPQDSRSHTGNQRANRKMSKVKALLRETQENAFLMNKKDLEKMFNLHVLGQQDGAEGLPKATDSTTKFYFDKIMASREKLKKMLPLFLQLLFFAVAGALIVGVFFSIVGFFFRNALIIMIIVGLLFAINYGHIDLTQIFGATK